METATIMKMKINSNLQLLTTSCTGWFATILCMAMSATLALNLIGCSVVRTGNRTVSEHLHGDSEFIIRFSSKGGFGDEYIEIKVRQDCDKPISILTVTGENQPVHKDYASNDPVAKKIDAIIAAGVFDLPSENRKIAIAGRDLPQVRITYICAHSDKTIIRDYHWGESFEPGFYQAEELFRDIIHLMNSNP